MPADPLAKPFDQWTLDDAREAVNRAVVDSVGSEDGYATRRLLTEVGEHWQAGRFFPAAGLDPAIRATVLTRLEPEHCPTDTANEALDTATNGLLGTEASISFPPLEAPVEGDEAAAAAAEEAADAMLAALSSWWDRVHFWRYTRMAARRSRAVGRGLLRAWVPPGLFVRAPANAAQDGQDPPAPGLPTGLSFSDALAHIALSAPVPIAATVYTQPDTQRQVAVFLYTGPDDQPRAELGYVLEGETQQTVLRIVAQGTAPGASADGGAPVAVGGRLPLAEMSTDLLLTESVLRQQWQLDFFGTILGRVMAGAGFRGRYTLNAQPTGIRSRTKPVDAPPLKTDVIDGETWYTIEIPRQMGPLLSNDLIGIELESTETTPDGTIITHREVKDPGVYIEEPVDPDFVIKAADYRRASILHDCKQGHLASTSATQVSGSAYIQQRAAHRADLENARGPLETMTRDVLAYVIALADVMTADGDPLKGFLDRFRVQVTARVDAGPLTPEERSQTIAEWKAGAISQATAQAQLGVEDTAAEAAALLRDPMAQLAYITAFAAAFAALKLATSEEGATRYLVAKGFDEAELQDLLARDTDGAGVTP